MDGHRNHTADRSRGLLVRNKPGVKLLSCFYHRGGMRTLPNNFYSVCGEV